jgi:cyclic beta-1,2-glucan synthetase
MSVASANLTTAAASEETPVVQTERYSIEHLEQHARRLSRELSAVNNRGQPREFLARLSANARSLRQAHRLFADAVKGGEPTANDVEWLLDNFSIVEEQLREIHEDLPRGFYRELPKLDDGQPRVYRLSLELVAHTECALDEETLVRFLRAFQEGAPLSIGENWAFPIMLRLALVENLCRITTQMVADRKCRLEAAQTLVQPEGLKRLPLHDVLDSCAPMLLELINKLEEQGSEHATQLHEFIQRLNSRGWDPAEIARVAHRRQAANQVLIGNVITSMRLISALDWMTFFEQTNLAERELRRDPANVYGQMDLATRDRYRREVERLAKGCQWTDVEVAKQAVAFAREAVEREASSEEHHVGYYVIGPGRNGLHAAIQYQKPLDASLTDFILKYPLATYFGGLSLVTVAVLAGLVAVVLALGGSWGLAVLMALVAIIPASEIAVGLVNFAITCRVPPRLLPKLEFRDGIPSSHAALVVVPAMLGSQKELESLVNRLELHYLANPDRALRFALLLDYHDANEAHVPGDRELLASAAAEMERLNDKYLSGGIRPFFLFHRSRQWNASEGRWMGWERKRGKLVELNRWLRGATTSYETVIGEVDAIAPKDGEPVIRYVITLDADTMLPAGTARRMIGALSHPLNRPHFRGDRVGSGYVLLQPRVGVTLESANRSWYARLFANSPGIDPYSTAASDLYQDLFNEGSFIGKGIYDLAAFEQALEGAFPENQILSHDLIEGCLSRAGLVSDIELIDSFPARYEAEAKRQHRWARGDWQLLPWLLPWIPSEKGWVANRLSAISIWKIVDNLRRSLVAPALLAFLLVGWFTAPALAMVWTLSALLVLCMPLLTHASTALWNWPSTPQWQEYRKGWLSELGRSFVQTTLLVVFLPHRALSMVDAIARTLWRLSVTRRRMLEWESAAAAEERLSRGYFPKMPMLWLSPLLGCVLLFTLPHVALPAAVPWLACWIIAPLAVHWLNQPYVLKSKRLTDSQLHWLRLAAQRTWSYFDRYVTADDNWLPPDNVQEYPIEKVAHRVSPTNEGLFLLSALAAREFGFTPLHNVVQLWERNLTTWQRFDRLHGHFYNWYDTVTLRPLPPRYVSTVDSGNLAVSFLTLKVGLDELRESEVFAPAQWTGVMDTIAVLDEICSKFQREGTRADAKLQDLATAASAIGACATEPASLLEWNIRMQALHGQVEQLGQRIDQFDTSKPVAWNDAPAFGNGLKRLVDGLVHDFETLFPWVALFVSEKISPQSRLGTLPPPWPLPDGQGSEAWSALLGKLEHAKNLSMLAALPEQTVGEIEQLRSAWARTSQAAAAASWLDKLKEALGRSSAAALDLDHRIESLATQVEKLALEMEFGFLYNAERKLFSIGFNVEDRQLDRSHYDMLASEARLATYLAIAKGDVEHSAWFRMNRGMTRAAGQVGIISWGGTMFEYLMPQLFHRDYEGSLITESCRMAVARQIEHGRDCGVPWGVSESAFGALAGNSDYHYKSFGVPGLGLKRGLGKDLVISPYSTFLAVEVDPLAAESNLRKLAEQGGMGTWGFYDAIDYTPERLSANEKSLIVRCYMAHHAGMSVLALANLLQAGVVRRRFHNHPLGRAGELLLQERVPTVAPLVEPPDDQAADEHLPQNDNELVSRRLSGYTTATPRTHLLSNGHYAVMVTNTGGGYSQHRDLAMTRWRSDSTCDAWGQFVYLRDVSTGRAWSATYQPTRAEPDSYQVIYSIDKAEFRRRDRLIETHLEVAVSPEHQVEVRQLKITNHGAQPVELDVTSYAEVVLAPPAADMAHPAFQKLFVETEYLSESAALVARRRPRDSQAATPWAVHVLAPGPYALDGVEYESSRERFLGKGGSLASPQTLEPRAKLTRSVGAVLDPIFSLRCRVAIPPHETATLAFATGFATSREEAVFLADTYHDLRGVQRAFEMAWAFNRVELRHIHLSPAKSHLFQRLASALLYPDPAHRAAPETLSANRQGQSGLWRYGISGDVPILLVHVTRTEHLDLVRDLLTAHRFWREHGLVTDLVVMNDNPGSYLDALQEQLVNLVNELHHQSPHNRPANIALLRGAQVSNDDKNLLGTAATVVLHGTRGSLAKQMEPPAPKIVLPPYSPSFVKAAPNRGRTIAAALADNRQETRASSPSLANTSPYAVGPSTNGEASRPHNLLFDNGIGGFSPDGKEYQLVVTDRHRPSKPWSNVLANPRFGCLTTESGGGYTWAENSREFKLTTWSNDPLLDSPSEWLYLREESTQQILRPLPQVVAPGQRYYVQHGRGYSRYQVDYPIVSLETTVFVAAEDPIKFVRVAITNRAAGSRRFSLTYFVEWVLGVTREQTQLHLATAWDQPSDTLTVRNAYHPTFPEQLAFLAVNGTDPSWTGDRGEFIGRNRSAADPAALQQPKLSGKTGAGLDPCGAVQTQFTLAPGEKREITFLLGSGANLFEVRNLAGRYRQAMAVQEALEKSTKQWDQAIGALQVRTPNQALDLLVNNWLLYQTIACRLFARTAFYQAGGAFGFRDQLQDVMAVVYSRPDLARAQLLRAAARQFEEGDVQHWWHPPAGQGTRTRFSDDYLWLPLVACHYVRTTGDTSVWDEVVPFLRSPLLESHEHERYETPQVSPNSGTLYEHCRRMFTKATHLGAHGLPLMGCGDWNDGMSKVGEQGRGESVWVGWFLLVILREFLPIMRQRGDSTQVSQLEAFASQLRHSLEDQAWDGSWYRRAFFDDGTPLGSAQNEECQIDSIAQSWAVFAGADEQRTKQAMDAVVERLVKKDERLVLLFTPAFDRSSHDPGYIKGYVPGVRENGGQYTHSALWVVQALAQLSDAERAMEIFDLINPIHHAQTPQDRDQYQVEPYVVAADVYGVAPHVGRGGWTWYTGSASWMYRVCVESLLGFQLLGDRLRINPVVPASWPKFELTWRWKSTTYEIAVHRPGVQSEPREVVVDGQTQPDGEIKLVDDGKVHKVTIGTAGPSGSPP